MGLRLRSYFPVVLLAAVFCIGGQKKECSLDSLHKSVEFLADLTEKYLEVKTCFGLFDSAKKKKKLFQTQSAVHWREQRVFGQSQLSLLLQTEPAVDLRQDVGDTFETPAGAPGGA